MARVDLGVMVEAQEGFSWQRWRTLATTVEDLGFESLWRSDHWFSFAGQPSQDSLDPFVALTFLAEVTKRIRFGPLVTAVTFRHPALAARMAAQIDQLSGGRVVFGVGAGWNAREHEAYGLPFPPLRERFDRLEEAIEVARALWGPTPANFEGKHYQLRNAECSPKPAQSPLPILVGGNGERRTLRIVARHADEWNALYLDVEAYRKKREVLAQHCVEAKRDPSTIKHTMMAAFLVGRDEGAIRRHLDGITNLLAAPRPQPPSLDGLRRRGWLIGTPGELVETCGRLAEAGVSRIMLHHLATDADDALELIARDVLPQL